MTAQFDQVSVVKKANIYFDGKCVSHTVIFPDGSKKTVGVIFPATLTFNTAAPPGSDEAMFTSIAGMSLTKVRLLPTKRTPMVLVGRDAVRETMT